MQAEEKPQTQPPQSLGFRLKVLQVPPRQNWEAVEPLGTVTQRQVSGVTPAQESPFWFAVPRWPFWQSLQLSQVSVASQVPSPHIAGQGPQSIEQVVHVSLPPQSPSPQLGGQAPQSIRHVLQVSSALQSPSPHIGGHAPQSASQVAQVSPPPQVPSPHMTGQAPQSIEQVPQVSLPLHAPSPQEQSPTHSNSVQLHSVVQTRRSVPQPQLPPSSIEPGEHSPIMPQPPSSTHRPLVQTCRCWPQRSQGIVRATLSSVQSQSVGAVQAAHTVSVQR